METMESKLYFTVKKIADIEFKLRQNRHELIRNDAGKMADDISEKELHNLLNDRRFFNENVLDSEFKDLLSANMDKANLSALESGADIKLICHDDVFLRSVISHQADRKMIEYLKRKLNGKDQAIDINKLVGTKDMSFLSMVKKELRTRGYLEEMQKSRDAKKIKYLYWLLTHPTYADNGMPHAVKKVIDVKDQKNTAIAFCKHFDCPDKWDSVRKFYRAGGPKNDAEFLEMKKLLKDILRKNPL